VTLNMPKEEGSCCVVDIELRGCVRSNPYNVVARIVVCRIVSGRCTRCSVIG
jgi:hypothetical protein